MTSLKHSGECPHVGEIVCIPEPFARSRPTTTSQSRAKIREDHKRPVASTGGPGRSWRYRDQWSAEQPRFKRPAAPVKERENFSTPTRLPSLHEAVGRPSQCRVIDRGERSHERAQSPGRETARWPGSDGWRAAGRLQRPRAGPSRALAPKDGGQASKQQSRQRRPRPLDRGGLAAIHPPNSGQPADTLHGRAEQAQQGDSERRQETESALLQGLRCRFALRFADRPSIARELARSMSLDRAADQAVASLETSLGRRLSKIGLWLKGFPRSLDQQWRAVAAESISSSRGAAPTGEKRSTERPAPPVVSVRPRGRPARRGRPGPLLELRCRPNRRSPPAAAAAGCGRRFAYPPRRKSMQRSV